MKLNLAVSYVGSYINDEDRPEFKTELKVVFAYISGALNGMNMEEIEEKCSWVKGVTLSPEASGIVNLYLEMASSEETKEGVNFMARYQADIKRHAEELARELALKMSSEMASEMASEMVADSTFTSALNLSKAGHFSFEKSLELMGVEEKKWPQLCLSIRKWRK